MPRSTAQNRPGGYARGHQASDVTEPQYRRGWELWSASLPEQEIRRQCRLTSAQFSWCLRHGSAEMPAWLHLYSEQVGLIRKTAAEAARLVSGKGLETIKLALSNGVVAGDALGRILGRVRQDIREAAKSGFEAAMPSDKVLAAVRTLSQVANVLPSIATTYRTIYGDSLRLSAADEELLAGEGSGAGVPAEFLEDVARWDDEQLDRYIETGEEPAKAMLGPAPDEDGVVETEVVLPKTPPEPPPKPRKKRAKRARKKTPVRKRAGAGGTDAGEAR